MGVPAGVPAGVLDTVLGIVHLPVPVPVLLVVLALPCWHLAVVAVVAEAEDRVRVAAVFCSGLSGSTVQAPPSVLAEAMRVPVGLEELGDSLGAVPAHRAPSAVAAVADESNCFMATQLLSIWWRHRWMFPEEVAHQAAAPAHGRHRPACRSMAAKSTKRTGSISRG